MNKFALAFGLAAAMLATAVTAQSTMNLDAFVTRANRIPMNPAGLLMPDAHRLKGEAERAFDAVGEEIRAARAAGRTPPACPTDRISLNARQFLAYLNGIPQARRRNMTLTDGVRSWMASRYPCN